MSGYKIIGGDGKEYGPVSDLQLRRWIGDGRADRGTMVRPEAETSWTPLGQVPLFTNCFPEEKPEEPALLPADENEEIARTFSESKAGLEPLSMGEVLVGARMLLNRNFGPVLAGCFFVWGTMMILNQIPMGWVGGLLLEGPLYGGLYYFLLQKRRGGEATAASTWERIRGNLLQLVMAGLIAMLIVRLMLFLIVPGIYFLVAWSLALLFVADREANAVAGLEESRRAATPDWFSLAGALMVAFLPLIAYEAYMNVKVFMAIFPIVQAYGFDMDRIMPIMQLEVEKSVFIIHLLQLATLPLASCVVVEAYERLSGRDRSA